MVQGEQRTVKPVLNPMTLTILSLGTDNSSVASVNLKERLRLSQPAGPILQP